MAVSDKIVWIDCEMTGLDTLVDELVEIAVVVTDADLNPLDAGLGIVIKPGDAALENMSDFVRSMHSDSGLLADIPHGVSVSQAEESVIEYVSQYVTGDERAPLAGNSIGTDRLFLAKSMPTLDRQLHYRVIDVSSIKELARRWFPRIYYNAPAKHGGHRALADIRESIRELAYYRLSLFPTPPGPNSADAQKLAASVVNEWASRM